MIMRSGVWFITVSAFCLAVFPVSMVSAGGGPPSQNPAMPEFGVSYEFPTGPVAPGSGISGFIRVEIPEGWHVYAPGVEKKYRKIEIISADGPVENIKLGYPPSRDLVILGEKVPVYDGEVVIKVEGRIAEGAEEGARVWRPVVSWQACSDNLCLAPESRTLEIPIVISAGAG